MHITWIGLPRTSIKWLNLSTADDTDPFSQETSGCTCSVMLRRPWLSSLRWVLSTFRGSPASSYKSIGPPLKWGPTTDWFSLHVPHLSGGLRLWRIVVGPREEALGH